MKLLAQWLVLAGDVAGCPIDRHTRGFAYTAGHLELDGGVRGPMYDAMRRAARECAEQLENEGLRWVKTEYVWLGIQAGD